MERAFIIIKCTNKIVTSIIADRFKILDKIILNKNKIKLIFEIENIKDIEKLSNDLNNHYSLGIHK